MNNFKKLSLTLALLITAATGAWADSFSADAYAANATLNGVSVNANQTVTINKGVTVTVNNGLTIQSNATLTVTGGGTLVVNGATGANGNDGWEDCNFDFNTGQDVWVYHNPTAGGTGGAAITIKSSAQLDLSNATVIAKGGQGGQGGMGMNGPDPFWAVSGANGNGFASFPAIDGAVLSYSTNGTDYTEYESGNTTLYRYMKVEPVVTISQDTETKQYEASFKMPQYDVTATYTIKRDISVDVTATMGDGTNGVRYRVKKSEQVPGKYEPAELNMLQVLALVEVYDGIEQKDLTLDEDYYCRIYKLDEQTLQPVGDGVELVDFDFAPGLYALKAFALDGSDYDGETALSNTFQLFQGYEVEVAAKEFITYYKDEPLYADTETSADAELYTITSVSADQAVLSAAIETAPSRTPLLIFNNSDQAKTFLLIPANEEPNLAITVAPEFVGTLEATTIAASTDDQTNYAFNGKAFVFVKNDLPVGANKAWLSISNSNARAISIVFDETTKIANTNITNITNGDWYTIDGRKVNAPSKKGIYIMNGKKVVVK